MAQSKEEIKVIVKVGRKAQLRLRNVGILRAVTAKELNKALVSYPGAIVIVEKVYQSEYAAVVQGLSAATSQNIFFYSPDNDEVTTGAADELGVGIYLNAKDLFNSVELNCGLNINPDISLNSSIGHEEESSNDDLFDNFFPDIEDTASQSTGTIKDIDTINSWEVSTITNKSEAGLEDLEPSEYSEESTKAESNTPETEEDIDNYVADLLSESEPETEKDKVSESTTESDAEPLVTLKTEAPKQPEEAFEEETEVQEKTEIQPQEEVKPQEETKNEPSEALEVTEASEATEATSETEQVEAAEADQETQEEVAETPDTKDSDNQVYEESQESSDTVASEESETTTQESIEPTSSADEALTKLEKLTAEKETAIAELEKSKQEVKKLKIVLVRSLKKEKELRQQSDEDTSTIAGLNQRMEESSKKIVELSKSIKSIKDERDLYHSELTRFESSDIIVDPATLSKFEEMKGRLEELKASALESSSKTSQEVSALQDKLKKLSEDLDAALSEKMDLEGKLGELEVERDTLLKDLNEARDTSAQDEQIQSLSEQLAEQQRALEEKEGQIETLETQISENKTHIANINISLGEVKQAKEGLLAQLSQAEAKVAEFDRLSKALDSERETNRKLYLDNQRISSALQDRTNSLKTLQDSLDQKVKAAREFAEQELQAARNDSIALKAQLDMTNQKLQSVESRYSNLSEMVGLTEDGASTLVENNKTLELINQGLRKQVVELQRSVDSYNKQLIASRENIENVKAQNNKLNSQVRAFSSNMTGGVSVGVIPPIHYTANARVISVVGSGSYGTTTTAFTLANYLASGSRVIYVDMDMVSAKADSWFKTSPLIQGVPGVTGGSSKSSGLGIIIDKGTNLFVTYADQIILKPVKTKNGRLDYLSGLYEKFDVLKLVSADFTQLFNYLGSCYDYIVVDCGRLGSSDINNQIIKVISDITLRTVMVTSADRIDIRNTRIEIQRARLDMHRVTWLINLAENTKTDDRVRNSISPAQYVQIPFVDDFYGQRKTFTSDRVSRERFKMFTEKCILGRQ